MTVTVEKALADEATFRSCMDLGLMGLKETAVFPVDFELACEQTYLSIAEGMAFIAKDEEGTVVGFISMYETGTWYSREKYLINRIGPYLRPDQRFGIAGVRLMRAVKNLADERDQLCFIWVGEPGRPRKNASKLFATVAGYVPAGHVVVLKAWHKQQMETVAA